MTALSPRHVIRDVVEGATDATLLVIRTIESVTVRLSHKGRGQEGHSGH